MNLGCLGVWGCCSSVQGEVDGEETASMVFMGQCVRGMTGMMNQALDPKLPLRFFETHTNCPTFGGLTRVEMVNK
jgi:hypothetical protein